MENEMGVIMISPEMAALLERQVSAGRCKTPADFVEEAVLRLVEEAESEGDDLSACIAAGDADIAAGRFVFVQTAEDERNLHEDRMARLAHRLKLSS